MNLGMFWPKIETGKFSLTMTKNCEPLFEQTLTRPQETLKFELPQPTGSFSFQPSIPVEGSWMIGSTNLGVDNFIIIITEEINKFELYKDPFHQFSITELKDEHEEILGFSDISPKHLQDKIMGLRVSKPYQKLSTEKGQTDAYNMLLMIVLNLHLVTLKAALEL